MFRQLFRVLRAGEGLEDAFEEFHQMLDHAHWMFTQANAALNRQIEVDSLRDPLYLRDQEINQLLREIRGRIVRHLTINPGMDVAASLALMSVAKDAERIGDYCKNVFEVARFYSEEFHVASYHDPLEAIRKDTEQLFTSVSDAFQRSDNAAAREARHAAVEIRGRCDDIIEQLLKDRENIRTHEAVAYSLLARHYKRVAAHLANICTAVLGKVEKLDFRP
jgi:phosphate transport system protein